MKKFFAFFVLSLGLALAQEPTSVKSYQLRAPVITTPAPNEAVRLMGFDAAGAPIEVLIDGSSLTATTVNGKTVLVASAPAKVTITVSRSVSVQGPTPTQTFTFPALANLNSVLVFRNGVFQSGGLDYDVNTTTRVLTFRPVSQLRPTDTVVYYWIETP